MNFRRHGDFRRERKLVAAILPSPLPVLLSHPYSALRNWPGSAHESASAEELSGSACGLAAHDVGSVRKGGCWASLDAGQGLPTCFWKCPPATHSQPRDLLWRGSPGTPQRVTWLLNRAAVW